MAKKITIALVGRPNVGKSSLFNRLIKKRKAIVDATPGVTRDRLYGEMEWEGRAIAIVDTGGFLPPDEATPILPQVIIQCQKAIVEADVIIFMTDVRTGLTPIDVEIMKYLRKTQKPVLCAVNKVDGEKQLQDLSEFYALGVEKIWPISAIHGHGIYELIDEALTLVSAEETKEEKIPSMAIKVALVGRPNVGKSSLFNRLVGDERSVVSDIPGTTRDTIDTILKYDDKTYLFMDTAGLRRKTRIKTRLERYSVKRALRAIKHTDITLLLLEAPEGITDQDIKIINYAIACGKCILIVVNKWDLMPTTSKFKREYIENIRQRLRFASFLPVITVSALKGEGLKQIFAMLNTLYQEYTLRISTGQLNRFVEEIWGKYQPPLYQNRPIKLYYITQVDIKPPTFVIFTNYPQAIPENYKRFLVNQLHQLGFKYIPLKLLFRERRRS